MEPNAAGDAPPLQPPPAIPGYYHPLQFQAYNMQPYLQPHIVFAPPTQSIPVPFPSYAIQVQGQGMREHQDARPGGAGVHRAQPNDLDPGVRKTLTDALRRGKEVGLSQREVLEHLQNEFKGIDWTAHFLVLPSGQGDAADLDESRGKGVPQGQGSGTSTPVNEPAQKKRKTMQDVRTTNRPRGRPRKVYAKQRGAPSVSLSRHRHSLAPSLSTASSSTRDSGGRPKRGGMLLEFHNETYIPPSDNSSKPIVPRRDPGDDLHKFTAEEKIFFIHYLRWRLRAGEVPTKYFLLAELAKELPHHNLDAWKKHWDDHPTLPDEIYIAARKRAEDEELLSNESDTSTLTPVTSSDDEYRPSSPRPSSSSPPATVPVSSPVSQKVTEDDLRAMASYMVEKRHVWDQYMSDYQRWEEFSRRKENLIRRSHRGWHKAALTYVAQIKQFYDEYMARKLDRASEDDRDERETQKLVYPPDKEEEPVVRHSAVPPGGSKNTGNLSVPEQAAISSRDSGRTAVQVERECIVISDSEPE